MTVHYVDHDGGNDGNTGLSFAQRKKLITAVTGCVAGDTMRIMSSPDPTSLGLAQWTNNRYPTANPSEVFSITSSTNATPIVLFTAVAHNIANGDTVFVQGHTTNTNANGVWEALYVDSTHISLTGSVGNGVGASGDVRKYSGVRVQLAAAANLNIAECGNQNIKANWTQSANVTCSKSTTVYKEGKDSQSIVVAAGFTTGLAAYVATLTTLDLSGYKGVSFWVKQTAGTANIAGDASLRLCTDVAGATPVHTIDLGPLTSGTCWSPVYVNVGSALNAAIRSVALYIDTDRGAVTFLIDNIVAVKDIASADCLHHQSLIGKGTADEPWWSIQSINGSRIMLDHTTQAQPNSVTAILRGYSGTTESVTTYKRGTTLASMTLGQTVPNAGSAGLPVAVEGGWNRTDMATQTGETWYDGRGAGVGGGSPITALTGKNYVNLNKVNFARFNIGYDVSGNDCATGTLYGCGNASTNGTVSNGSGTLRWSFTSIISVQCATCLLAAHGAVGSLIKSLSNSLAGLNILGNALKVTTVVSSNNAGDGISASEKGARIDSATVRDNTSYGLNVASANSGDLTIGVLEVHNNLLQGIRSVTSGAENIIINGGSSSTNGAAANVPIDWPVGKLYLRNFTINEAVNAPTQALAVAFTDPRVHSENHDLVARDNRIWTPTGNIFSDSAIHQTAGGISWKLSPLSITRTVNFPLDLVIARIACSAAQQVTVQVYMLRDNTGLTFRLMCRGRQLAGVATDVFTAMTASASVWEPVAISFTPTEDGVVEIRAEAYGGTTYSGWVDGVMAVTQG